MSTEANAPPHQTLLAEAESLLQQRRCGDALTLFDRAVAAGADKDWCAGGTWIAHMLLGNYEQAWITSDEIRARGKPDPHRFWQGQPIDGARVIIRCLRGYGDTVMYLRWLPELRWHAREVIVQVCPEMLPVVVATIPTRDEPAALRGNRPRTAQCPVRLTTWLDPGQSDSAEWDVQVESAELPYLFRATAATLPAPARLFFPGFQLAAISTRLGPRTRPRVGLVWTGSSYDPSRSIPFPELRPLLANQAVEFWSLQAPGNNDEWVRFCAENGWQSRTFYTRETADDEFFDHTIVDMAAFASQLDLVVTIDTLAAHIAGSLGTPTWLLLKHAADWRWIVDRPDTPWYPGMTLLRQSAPGDWTGVLQTVNETLRDWAQEVVA